MINEIPKIDSGDETDYLKNFSTTMSFVTKAKLTESGWKIRKILFQVQQLDSEFFVTKYMHRQL